MKEIVGMKSAYKEALNKIGNNMEISASLVIDLIDAVCELESEAIDLKACLRTCYNTAKGGLDQYE